jgi:hypothetical protein
MAGMAKALAPMMAAPPSSRRGWQLLKWLLGAAVGALLAYFLLHQVDMALILEPLRLVPPAVWVLAGAGWILSFVFRAARLQQEWRPLRQVALTQALRIVLLHNASVLLLPFRAGEAAYPVLTRAVFGSSWAQAVRSLLWLRFQDAVVLAVLGVALWPDLSSALRAGALSLGLALLLSLYFLRQRLRTAQGWLAHLAPVLERTSWQSGWGWSAANWLTKLLVVGLLLSAMLSASLLTGLQAALGGELMALLPLQGPAGLGTYEAGVWLALMHAPLPMGQVALAALAAHIFCLMLSLGLGALAWGYARQTDPPVASGDGLS